MDKVYRTYRKPLKEQRMYCGGPKGGDREKGVGSLFKERMASNFPKLERDLYIHVHEANSPLQNFNPK